MGHANSEWIASRDRLERGRQRAAGIKPAANENITAAMVWLIPSAEAAAFHVIALMTYLIGVGGFQHIVAGSFEDFYWSPTAKWGWGK